MNPHERERLVDSALDRALGPQRVEPRTGMEGRILANLQSQPERRPWWRWMWVPALAAAAVLAVVIGMRVMHIETPAPVQVKNTIESPKPEVATRPQPPVAERNTNAIPRRKGPRPPMAKARVETARAMPPAPKQEVFPSPLPTTEQERLLLALVRQHPEQAKAVAIEQQAERERVQKYLETGDVSAEPTRPQQLR